MTRSKNIIIHTFLNYIFKILNIAIRFILVPITIEYLGKEKYGLWSVILSMITWANLSDFGIGNGLRNKLTYCLANNEKDDAKQYVSTAYFAITIISICSFIVFSILNFRFELFDYANIREIKITIYVIIVTFSVHFILNIARFIAYAKQKSSYIGFSQVINSAILLVAITLLSRYKDSNLIYIALVYSLAMLTSSFILNYIVYRDSKWLLPKYYEINNNKIASISNLGMKFFIIQVCNVILMSTDNFIIAKFIGYSKVTDYSVVFKIYNNLNMIFSTLLIAIWSGVTHAVAKKDYAWINKTKNKLLLLLIPYIVILIIVTIFIDNIIHLWIGNSIVISKSLVIISFIYNICIAFSGIYINIINGLGKIKIQMFIYIISALINIPLSIYFSVYLNMGISGVKLATLFCVLPLMIIIPIQYRFEMKKWKVI